MAKIASPAEPPIWRTNELSPAASASLCRGMLLSAAVVSATNRKENPTPVTDMGSSRSTVEVSSVM